MGKRLLHSKILLDFRGEYVNDLSLLIKRATAKQTIIKTRSPKFKSFNQPTEVESFLRNYSKAYPNIIQAAFLAKGGEAIVYRIEHEGPEEIVARCPLLGELENEEETKEVYDALFYDQ